MGGLRKGYESDREDFKERVVELEGTVSNLENELEEQSKNANDVVAQWQASYAALEENTSQEPEDDLKTKLEEYVTSIESLHDEKEDLSAELNAYKTNWRTGISAKMA